VIQVTSATPGTAWISAASEYGSNSVIEYLLVVISLSAPVTPLDGCAKA
jgi:hypothetical protein